MKTGRERELLLVTVLVIVLIVVFTGCSEKIGGENLDKVKNETCEYIIQKIPEASIGGEWTVFALKKSDTKATSDEYFESYYDNIRGTIKAKKGTLSDNQYTAYESVSMALTTIGKNPKDVEGYDLTKRIDDYASVSDQGYNAEMFALISSEYCGFKLKNESKYIDDILRCQIKNGAMTFDGKTADIDMTAMGIQALAPCKSSNKKCAKAINSALSYLSKKQNKDGSYGNAESTAQVIIALSTLKRDPMNDAEFAKTGKNLGDGLMEYRSGRGFAHKKGENINMMATEQALRALDAFSMGKEGKSIYEK